MDLVNRISNKESAIQALQWCVSMGTSQALLLKHVLNKHFRSRYQLWDNHEECEQLLVEMVKKNSHELLSEFLKYTDKSILSRSLSYTTKKNLSTKLLIIAVENGYADICDLLVEYGADVNAYFHGKSLFSYSLVIGHIHVAKILYEAGANIHSKDSRGETALAQVLTSSTNEKDDRKVFIYILSVIYHGRSLKGAGAPRNFRILKKLLGKMAKILYSRRNFPPQTKSPGYGPVHSNRPLLNPLDSSNQICNLDAM